MLCEAQIHAHVQGISRNVLVAGLCPNQGHLATDHDGTPLLLLHSKAAARATAIRIPLLSSDTSAKAEVRCLVG
jgi:hypothetical protein